MWKLCSVVPVATFATHPNKHAAQVVDGLSPPVRQQYFEAQDSAWQKFLMYTGQKKVIYVQNALPYMVMILSGGLTAFILQWP